MINIIKNYFKILEVLTSLGISQEINKSGRKAKMSDIEVIALSFTAEYMFIDSENSLFRQLTDLSLPNLIERIRHNKRKRLLFGFTEKIRLLLASKFTQFEDYFIIESMPLKICKNS